MEVPAPALVGDAVPELKTAAAPTTVEVAPRAELVKVAVNFLRHSNVQEADLGQKVVFLEKKGLTKAEIDQALSLASAHPVVMPHLESSPLPSLQSMGNTPQTPWISLIVTAAIAGGISGLVAPYLQELLGNYIPWVRVRREARDAREQRILEANDTIERMEKHLQRQADSLEAVKAAQERQNQHNHPEVEIAVLRAEMTALRNMMHSLRTSIQRQSSFNSGILSPSSRSMNSNHATPTAETSQGITPTSNSNNNSSNHLHQSPNNNDILLRVAESTATP
jgi:hypothetical protein